MWQRRSRNVTPGQPPSVPGHVRTRPLVTPFFASLETDGVDPVVDVGPLGHEHPVFEHNGDIRRLNLDPRGNPVAHDPAPVLLAQAGIFTQAPESRIRKRSGNALVSHRGAVADDPTSRQTEKE